MSSSSHGSRVLVVLVVALIAASTLSSQGHAQQAEPAAPEMFVTGDTCARCHDRLTDARGRDVSIYHDWLGTMMANAARDPLWQAKMASELLREPHIANVIQERCARCHTPMARWQTIAEGGEVTLVRGGFLDAANPRHALAADGVSCTLCHQLQGWHGDAPRSGTYAIDSDAVMPWREAYGPYDEPFAMPMRHMSGYTPALGRHLDDPEFCSQCHTLYVPIVANDGSVHAEAPEQTPGLEWKESVYARKGTAEYRTCQGCHMPDNGSPARISTMPGRLAPREPFHLHLFVGANRSLPEMLADNASTLGLGDEVPALRLTARRAEVMLQSFTARLSLTAAPARDGLLEVPVRVTSLVGHKLPAGIPARRVWLHVTVRDNDGAVVFESGRPLPDGSIQGNDADENAAAFEPHHEIITRPDEVQVYEVIMGDPDRKLTYTLLRSSDHLKDNRLLPAGFDRATARHDVQVHGSAIADSDFIGGSDTVLYRVDPGGAEGPLVVTAELLYQTASFAFLRDLLSERSRAPEIERFARFYESADKAPVVVATSQVTVPAPPSRASAGIPEPRPSRGAAPAAPAPAR